MEKYTIKQCTQNRLWIRCTEVEQSLKLGATLNPRENFFQGQEKICDEWWILLEPTSIIGCHKEWILNSGYTNFIDFDQVDFGKETFIGYKVPYDLFGTHIKKDTIYTKDNFIELGIWWYTPQQVGYGEFRLPSEIVERWEPVYE